jgi:hypothetical protein
MKGLLSFSIPPAAACWFAARFFPLHSRNLPGRAGGNNRFRRSFSVLKHIFPKLFKELEFFPQVCSL